MYVWPFKMTSTELPHLLLKGWGIPPVYYSQLIGDTAVLEDVDSVLVLRPVGERGWDVGESFNRLELGLWPAASTALSQAPPPLPTSVFPPRRLLMPLNANRQNVYAWRKPKTQEQEQQPNRICLMRSLHLHASSPHKAAPGSSFLFPRRVNDEKPLQAPPTPTKGEGEWFPKCI